MTSARPHGGRRLEEARGLCDGAGPAPTHPLLERLVRQILQGAGVLKKGRARGRHRRRRERKESFGEMLHLDGSPHRWMELVSKTHLTQVGQALHRLGIEHIPSYSPQARGRSERMNRTLQDRLVNELRVAGASTLEQANTYLDGCYIARYNVPGA